METPTPIPALAPEESPWWLLGGRSSTGWVSVGADIEFAVDVELVVDVEYAVDVELAVGVEPAVQYVISEAGTGASRVSSEGSWQSRPL